LLQSLDWFAFRRYRVASEDVEVAVEDRFSCGSVLGGPVDAAH